jgi:chromosomal replication initiator protein
VSSSQNDPARLIEAGDGSLPSEVSLPFERRVAEALSARIGAARFTLWFHEHTRFTLTGRAVEVVARNDGCREWLEHTFGNDVRQAIAAAHGTPVEVIWSTESGANGKLAEPLVPADNPAPRIPATSSSPRVDLFGDPLPKPKTKAKRADADADVAAPSKRSGRRWRSLQDFISGACNRVASASAQSIVEEPGQAANPLVLHGPVGTGKTHLLEGVYVGLRRRGDKPCFVTAEEFTSRFVQASRLGKMGAFRRHFRECSALLLDNLNFLATKRATQEEFLHTFDALVGDGRQVVVSTDCHPGLADELMPELVDRLLGGAVWGLLPPDPETRLEILRKKAGTAEPSIADAVLKFVASSLRGNVRELEGAVNAIRHYARVTGRPVDLALVREAIGDLLRHAVRVVSVADVDAAVCKVLGLPSGALQGKGRSWAVSHPRMLAVFLCRKHTAATYGEISKHFGAKTHSTAVASEKRVRAWLDRDLSVAIGGRDWRAKDLLDRVERELHR